MSRFFMTYAVQRVVLAANAINNNLNVQIQDYDFEARFLVANSTGQFSAQIIDAGQKRPLTNIQVLNTLLFGTAQNPMPLVEPYVFKKKTLIQVQVTDLSGAPNTLDIAIMGVELV